MRIAIASATLALALTAAAEGRALALETGQESASELLQLLRKLNHPGLGVNFDPANMILYGKGETRTRALREEGQAAGALALGAPAAHADETVVDQSTVVEQQPSVGAGDESTSERRKARVFIIGKTTKPHMRQG